MYSRRGPIFFPPLAILCNYVDKVGNNSEKNCIENVRLDLVVLLDVGKILEIIPFRSLASLRVRNCRQFRKLLSSKERCIKRLTERLFTEEVTKKE